MLSLCKRNLLLYFRDKSGVFFSILGAMISLVLYVIFIKKVCWLNGLKFPEPSNC